MTQQKKPTAPTGSVWDRYRGAILTVAGVAIVGGVALAWPHPSPTKPSPTPTRASALPQAEKPRVLVRVGGTDVTTQDLDRYQRVKQLGLGVTGGKEALDELCDRLRLDLEGTAHGITLSDADKQQELFRRKVIIGATAGALQAPGASGRGRAPGANPAGSPWDNADQVLRAAGVSVDDLGKETAAEGLATRAKRALVYDLITVSDRDVKAALVAEQPDASATKAGTPASADLDRVRERLQRERGQKPLADLQAQLRSRWPAVPAETR